MESTILLASSLWVVVFATSSERSAVDEGIFEYRSTLNEYKVYETNNGKVHDWCFGSIFLFKYKNANKYAIGFPTPDEFDEEFAFAANQIKHHNMHCRIFNVVLENGRSMMLSFEKFADARRFYESSSDYKRGRRSSVGPFELTVVSLQATRPMILTMYELNDGMLCEFKSRDNESSSDPTSRVQIVIPTAVFSHTRVYGDAVVGLAAEKIGKVKVYYVLKFQNTDDARSFNRAVEGESAVISDSQLPYAIEQLCALHGFDIDE